MTQFYKNTQFCNFCGEKLEICSGQKIRGIRQERKKKVAEKAQKSVGYISHVLSRMSADGIACKTDVQVSGVFNVDVQVRQSCFGNAVFRSLWTACASFQLIPDYNGKYKINPQSIVYRNRFQVGAFLLYLLSSWILSCFTTGLLFFISMSGPRFGSASVGDGAIIFNFLPMVFLLFFMIGLVVALIKDKEKSINKLNEWMAICNSTLANTDI